MPALWFLQKRTLCRSPVMAAPEVGTVPALLGYIPYDAVPEFGQPTSSVWMEAMPTKVLKRRRSYHGSDAWWFAATAVLVLIALVLFTLLLAALELRLGAILIPPS